MTKRRSDVTRDARVGNKQSPTVQFEQHKNEPNPQTKQNTDLTGQADKFPKAETFTLKAPGVHQKTLRRHLRRRTRRVTSRTVGNARFSQIIADSNRIEKLIESNLPSQACTPVHKQTQQKYSTISQSSDQPVIKSQGSICR